jgi:hypothetical protein
MNDIFAPMQGKGIAEKKDTLRMVSMGKNNP